MPQFPSYLPLIVAAFALTVALVTDLRGLRIPNLLTFPLLLSGIAYQAGSPQGQGLIFGLLGLFVATTPFLLMYSLNAMGAGDVKLVAGLGMWLVAGHQFAGHRLAAGCWFAGCRLVTD